VTTGATCNAAQGHRRARFHTFGIKPKSLTLRVQNCRLTEANGLWHGTPVYFAVVLIFSQQWPVLYGLPILVRLPQTFWEFTRDREGRPNNLSRPHPGSKETNTRAAAALIVQRDFRPCCVQGGPNNQSLRPPCDFHLQKQHTHTAVVFIQLIS
jgi:hypothetical protein